MKHGATGYCALAFLLLAVSPARCAASSEPGSSTSGAVERGLHFIQTEAFRWKDTRKCAACHHAATMLWTFNEARAAGYATDEKALKEITEWAFLDMKTNSLADEPPPRNVINLGWVYVLLSTETAPESRLWARSAAGSSAANPADTNYNGILSAERTLIRQIIAKQAADGSWGVPLDLRVPLGGPSEDIAILSRLALLESGVKSESVLDCMNKAAAWLAGNHDPQSRQARNFRLLTNLVEGTPVAKLKPTIAGILAEQNPDGGWSQTPEMASDAYATGQTLYVLARAGVRPKVAEMKRGVQFLTRVQREDGSWPMTSRVKAKNLNPITVTGTAWAVLGLLRGSG